MLIHLFLISKGFPIWAITILVTNYELKQGVWGIKKCFHGADEYIFAAELVNIILTTLCIQPICTIPRFPSCKQVLIFVSNACLKYSEFLPSNLN